jgi:hypothetical protein
VTRKNPSFKQQTVDGLSPISPEKTMWVHKATEQTSGDSGDSGNKPEISKKMVY